MAMFDAEVQFNLGEWSSLIATQTRLFTIKGLTRVSDTLREDFHCGHRPGRHLPELPPAEWATNALNAHTGNPLGYDLPCLLERNDTNRGRIMLCAQDPFRREPASGNVSVGTFFGIDNPDFRHRKRHYRVMWDVITACMDAGYSVWVTDAIKIFAGKDVVKRDPELMGISRSTLSDEIRAVAPVRILALGNDAAWMLKTCDLPFDIAEAIHPAARSTRPAWYLKGATTEYEDCAAGRRSAMADYYCRKIFKPEN